MVKHTHTTVADEFFEFVWPFCGVGTWRGIYDFDLGIMTYPHTQKKPDYLPNLTNFEHIFTRFRNIREKED